MFLLAQRSVRKVGLFESGSAGPESGQLVFDGAAAGPENVQLFAGAAGKRLRWWARLDWIEPARYTKKSGCGVMRLALIPSPPFVPC